MSKIHEISGIKFGLLTAVRLQYIDGKYTEKWECRCECGSILFVKQGNLLSGNTKTCGCTRGLKNRHNIAGEQFGRWTVLYRIEDDTDRHSKWMCECSCGNQKIVYHDNLVGNKTISCGCYNQERIAQVNFVDKTGTQIGQLMVLERVKLDKGTRGVKWRCRCSCGTELILSTIQLSYRISCGCAQHQHRTRVDITGKRFGKLTALYRIDLDRDSHNKIFWTCQCDCGNIVNIARSNLQSGNTRSCGCLDDRVNTKPVSQQQRKLQAMLGGELNYKFGTYFIDLMLNDHSQFVAIEYDSYYWHKSTQEHDQIKTQKYLAGGFKVLRIRGVYKIPEQEELLDALNCLYTTDSIYKEITLDDWDKRAIYERRLINTSFK